MFRSCGCEHTARWLCVIRASRLRRRLCHKIRIDYILNYSNAPEIIIQFMPAGGWGDNKTGYMQLQLRDLRRLARRRRRVRSADNVGARLERRGGGGRCGGFRRGRLCGGAPGENALRLLDVWLCRGGGLVNVGLRGGRCRVDIRLRSGDRRRDIWLGSFLRGREVLLASCDSGLDGGGNTARRVARSGGAGHV